MNTTIQQSKKTYPILVEFLPVERRFQDPGPDKLPADIGGGKLTLDPASGGFDLDWDVFAWTHADETQPQLMTQGRMVSLCQDYGAAHLAVHKPGKPAAFPFSGINPSSYCVAPNGVDLYCTDQNGRLFQRCGEESPRRIGGRRIGFRVHGFDANRKNLIVTRHKNDKLTISALNPDTGAFKELTSTSHLPGDQESPIVLSPSGRSLFVQSGMTVTRIRLEDGSSCKTRLYSEECYCTEDRWRGPYTEEVLEQSHLCGPTLKSALDDSHFVLAEDSFGYGEEDYYCEWPFWQRSVSIKQMETGEEYYQSWRGGDEFLSLIPMNGKSGGWSRYHRKFEETAPDTICQVKSIESALEDSHNENMSDVCRRNPGCGQEM